MTGFADARWYAVRPAANRKPSTYRCPLCGGLLPALSAHQLVVPEGDGARRRHAHTACVMDGPPRRAAAAARRGGAAAARGCSARLLRRA